MPSGTDDIANSDNKNKGKYNIENINDNTYGIEIEFATHDCEMLSFTHIEVWNLYPDANSLGFKKPEQKEMFKGSGWKIETDADYTLELVSPILEFSSQEKARKFKTGLMALLQTNVQKGILLTELTVAIRNFVKSQFTFNQSSGIWKYDDKSETPKIQLSESFINNTELAGNLVWFNWDEDSNLKQVLAAREILKSDVKVKVKLEDKEVEVTKGELFWQNIYNSILLTSSQKHGGLPSSQMNIPLTLTSYVNYDYKYKLTKAWDRLLETETYMSQNRNNIGKTIETAYNALFADPIWNSKYLNEHYLDAQIDTKKAFWHRYWLWLNTFTKCAQLFNSDAKELINNTSLYKKAIDNIIQNPGFTIFKDATKAIKSVKVLIVNSENPNFDLLAYLTIQKLVSGTLSEMSEKQQGLAQQQVMNMKGEMEMDDILSAFPDKNFFQFHYALKDLTPLWFKSPLVDVLENENKESVKNFKEIFKSLGSRNVSMVITTVLKANLSLLGWYHGVAAANNQPFDYDWDDFLSYNMPSLTAFGDELLMTCEQFNKYLNLQDGSKELLKKLKNKEEFPESEEYLLSNPFFLNTEYRDYLPVYEIEDLPPDAATFLQRDYPNFENKPINLKIVRWEGRWDTMKAPIQIQNETRYLIEHRNN